MKRWLLAMVLLLISLTGPAGAQSTGTSSPGSTGPATTAPATTPGTPPAAAPAAPITNPAGGGAVGPSGAPHQLSLRQAIDYGIHNNLSVLLSQERTREAKARALEARAPLMPTLYAAAQESNQTISLAALGFNGSLFPGVHFPSSVGPFYTFDSRLYLTQSLFNLAAMLRARAGRLSTVLAQMQVRLSVEQVAATVEMAYLTLLRQRRAVEDARANVALAQSLLTLAQHQHDAGIATGLDVTRADTRLASQRVRLSQALTAERDAEIVLERLVGVPMSGSVELTDPLAYGSEKIPAADQAIGDARNNRVELQIVRQEIDIYGTDVRAAHAEHYPTLNVAADYGVAGSSPASVDRVHDVALQLNIPIYNGGLTNARVQEAESQLHQVQLQYNDLQDQIEQDVRQALAALQTAGQQVEESVHELELALKELKMARDRFGAGLGDNIEVINAQTAVADARDTQAAALTAWHNARINLASALGRAEQFHF